MTPVARKLPEYDVVARLVVAGVSPKEIAAHFECSTTAVYTLLRDNGTSVRLLAPRTPRETSRTPRSAHRSSQPFVAPPEWTVRAKCADRDLVTDPDVFHPGSKDWPTLTLAKKICQTCPVRDECLAYALEHDEPDGVWGGLSVNQRRKLLRERGQAVTA